MKHFDPYLIAGLIAAMNVGLALSSLADGLMFPTAYNTIAAALALVLYRVVHIREFH